MIVFFKKYKPLLILSLFLLAAFLFFAFNLRDGGKGAAGDRLFSLTSPIQKGTSAPAGFIRSLWHSYIDLVDLRRENENLTAILKQMKLREVESRETVIENARLKSLLEMKSRLQLSTVTASVIGEDGYPWFKTITIDSGIRDGVIEGAPVLAASGIVGQVIRVSDSSARVLLLTDQASSVAGMIERTRARGVVKGKGFGKASLEFAMRDEDIKAGDIVVTSGIGKIFPKGIQIGEVSMVKKGDYGIFQQIEIRPSVNLSRLEEVLVVKGENISPNGRVY